MAKFAFLTCFIYLFQVAVFAVAQDSNPRTSLDNSPTWKLPSSKFSLSLDTRWKLEVASDSTNENAADEVLWSRDAHVPSAWERDLGIDFDGQATYRRVFTKDETLQLESRWRVLGKSTPHQLLLHLEGVATFAKVRCNGKPVGEHVGAWTPWDCDLTTVWNHEGENSIEVEVDELVGHHTQGFLPIVAPHFGGIWKPVTLQLVPETRILENKSLVLGQVSKGRSEFALRLALSRSLQDSDEIEITVFPAKRINPKALFETTTLLWEKSSGEKSIARFNAKDVVAENGELVFDVPVKDGLHWSCDHPWLYDIQVRLLSNLEGADELQPLSESWFRTGIRTIETSGHQLLLNNQAINVRGVLNWGYSPPSTSPTLSISQMQKELQVAKAMELNLMKFCLYVPPREYLELCDLLGCLAWIEYPTWHAQLVPENLAALSGEYREFTHYDRNHPSVILRSLTCETGSGADLEVIRSLYKLVHDQIPGCIVEDDSSWISWNRVSDFWDDHPYGNNDTWVQTLTDLKKYIAENGEKPLLLGEAIAADTWPRLDDPSDAFEFGFADAASVFSVDIENVLGSVVAQRMRSDSYRYALLMRKYQLETYRREVPWGGFVVSVIRDFPLASMGLIDRQGDYKFESRSKEEVDEQAYRWNPANESLTAPAELPLIETAHDRRSFWTGESFDIKVLFATPKPEQFNQLSLIAKLQNSAGVITTTELPLHRMSTESDSNGKSTHWQAKLKLKAPQESGAFQLTLSRRSATGQLDCENVWTFWALDRPQSAHEVTVGLHSSLSQDLAVIDQLRALGCVVKEQSKVKSCDLIVGSHWDLELIEALKSGARVLMLPDGKKNSFVLGDQWFLRGGPIVNWGTQELGKNSTALKTPDELDWNQALVELQHFDLSSKVQRDFDYWNSTTPFLLLWDTHDIKEVKVHGLVWLATVGDGRLAVSCLNHSPQRSAIGPALLQQLIERLVAEEGSWNARRLPDSIWNRLESELRTVEVNLAGSQWRLQADPNFEGEKLGWHLPRFDTRDWSPIRIDRHWEGQGLEHLDGWAWYACDVKIPDDWNAEEFFLCFTGVDDHYRAFVNGTEVGSAGVIDTKETAFEMRSSYPLPGDVKAGDTITIRVAVYDWYGSGGIFRPVFLRTQPLSDSKPMLAK